MFSILVVITLIPITKFSINWSTQLKCAKCLVFSQQIFFFKTFDIYRFPFLALLNIIICGAIYLNFLFIAAICFLKDVYACELYINIKVTKKNINVLFIPAYTRFLFYKNMLYKNIRLGFQVKNNRSLFRTIEEQE